MCPNSAPRPCRAQAQTQRYNRVCESLSWVSSRKKVRETCQTQLTFSDSLSALPSYIVSDTFSPPAPARFDHASQDFRGERVNRWANPTEKTTWLPRNRCPAGEQTGDWARKIMGTPWRSCKFDKVPCSPSLTRRRLSARDECRF